LVGERAKELITLVGADWHDWATGWEVDASRRRSSGGPRRPRGAPLARGGQASP
jgi:hypothetical protein